MVDHISRDRFFQEVGIVETDACVYGGGGTARELIEKWLLKKMRRDALRKKKLAFISACSSEYSACSINYLNP